jgi:hypothetical protein
MQQQTVVLDGPALRRQLGPTALPPEIPESEFIHAVYAMAQEASKRTVMNQCGGLPAPAVAPRSPLRWFLDLFHIESDIPI